MMKSILIGAGMLVLSAIPAFANYGAIAVAVGNRSDGRATVATGVATAGSQRQADRNAIAVCEERNNNDLVSCTVKTRFFNGGCGATAIGVNGGHVYFGTGPNKVEALEMCSQYGPNCGQPIGACTNQE